MEAPRGRRRSGRPSRQASRRGWTCSTRPRCTAAAPRSGGWASSPRADRWSSPPSSRPAGGQRKSAPRCAGPEPGSLRRSTIGLYQHHFPSRRVSIPSLMGLMADAVEAGKVRAIGVSNLFRGAAPHRSRGAGRAGDSSCLQPGGVLPAAPIAGGEWGAGCLPGVGDHADRLPAAGPGRPHRHVSAGESAQGDSALRPLLPG
jgi:hypothetical protein